jgi:hypothetical protein
MDNPIPHALPSLFALAHDAVDGAHGHGAAIGLKQNTEVALGADTDAAVAAEEAFAAAKTAKDDANTGLRIADSNARSFIKACSACFAQTISQNWTTAWAATGFPNRSTAVPSTQDARYALLTPLGQFFTDHPNMAVNTPKLVLTAARAQALATALADARQAVNEANTDAGSKRDARDLAVEQLRNRLRGLIAELTELLDDHSPLWEAFGLNEPGADATPDVPAGLVATAGGIAGSAHLDWAHARNAEHYRVWQLIVGVDTDFSAVASPADTEVTLTHLPSGKTVQLQVTAVNGSAESQPSAPVPVVVA